MKHIKHIAVSLAALVGLQSTVFGANLYNISTYYNPETERVTVSGNAGAENAGKRVELVVLKPYVAADDEDTKTEYTLEDLTEDNAAELIFALRSAKVNADGGFSFVYKWNEEMPGGNFSYKVAVQGSEVDEEDRSYSAYFMGVAELNEAISNLLSSDVSVVISGLEQDHLGIDAENSFYVENKRVVAEKFIALVDEGEYDLEGLKVAYKSLYETAIFYGKVDEGAVTAEDIENYCNNKGIELPEGYLDAEAEEDKEAIDGTIDDIVELMNENKGGDLLDDDSLLQMMAMYNALAEVNNAGRKEMSDIVETRKDELDISSLSQYRTYSNLSENEKIQVNISLANKKFTTVSDFSAAFKKAVNDFENEEESTPSRPSSGGSGGGKSSSYFAPTLDNELPKTAEEVYKKTFDDLSQAEWAREAVENFAGKGWVNGVDEHNFAPSANITRAEFVKILVNVMQIESEGAELTFEDCKNSDWYYDYVKTAVAAGIVNGVSETEFGANLPITRQDMCVMVKRAADFKNIKLSAKGQVEFADAKAISEYAAESVEILAGASIISGKGNGVFDPLSKSTRAEATVILYRLVSAVK